MEFNGILIKWIHVHRAPGWQWGGKFSMLQNASAGVSSNWVSGGEDVPAELMLFIVVATIHFGDGTIKIKKKKREGLIICSFKKQKKIK